MSVVSLHYRRVLGVVFCIATDLLPQTTPAPPPPHEDTLPRDVTAKGDLFSTTGLSFAQPASQIVPSYDFMYLFTSVDHMGHVLSSRRRMAGCVMPI